MDKVALPKAYLIHLFIKDEMILFQWIMLHYPRLMRFTYLLKFKGIISVDKVALPKAYVIHFFSQSLNILFQWIKLHYPRLM